MNILTGEDFKSSARSAKESSINKQPFFLFQTRLMFKMRSKNKGEKTVKEEIVHKVIYIYLIPLFYCAHIVYCRKV